MKIIQVPLISDTEPIKEPIDELKAVLNHLDKKNEKAVELNNKLHALPIPEKHIAMVLEVLFGE